MPGIVNRPSARVIAAYVVPEGTCTATTRAPSIGAPEESVAMPATAEVVTPWASNGPVEAREKTATATTARLERTIQCMSGPLLRGVCGTVRVPMGSGEKVVRAGKRVKALGRRVSQQIERGNPDQNIWRPCGKGRGQHTPRADRFRELEHQQHNEGGGEARRHAPCRAALRRRNRERRAE